MKMMIQMTIKYNKIKKKIQVQGKTITINKLKTYRQYKPIGHGTTFKDFALKDELLRAIKESGFEHPS